MLGSSSVSRKLKNKYFRDKEEVSYQFLMERVRHNKPFRKEDLRNGKMILAAYSPKDNKSPYDKNPLILIIYRTSRHILGLNLHWLPPKGRVLILRLLFQHNANNIRMNKPLEVSSALSKQFWRLARPIFRKYIVSRLSRRGVVVQPHEMDKIIMLPSERFIGISSTQAYLLSLSKLRQGS